MVKYNKRRDEKMLKYFEVTNFRGFEDTLSVDFSNHRDYSFNTEFIKNDLVNKGLIYGKNGSGKSNFGFALFDIMYHLTDKYKSNLLSYQNGNFISKPVKFKYVFKFDNDEVTYEYEKSDQFKILNERLQIGTKLMINYNFSQKENITLLFQDAETLRDKITSLRQDQSVIKFIYMNSSLKDDSILSKLMSFVDKMLWFRSVKDNQFVGYKENPEQLAEMLDSKKAVKDFEHFLFDVDQNLKFDLSIEKDFLGKKLLVANFKNGTKIPFNAVASTGTLSLWLFFCWSLEFKDISFLFIDEFDAFYHYETSEYILNYINKRNNFQSFVTTHNTALMSNALIRPDCCFVVSNNRYIKSLPDCTDKEIREAHNLERIYRNGGFTI